MPGMTSQRLTSTIQAATTTSRGDRHAAPGASAEEQCHGEHDERRDAEHQRAPGHRDEERQDEQRGDDDLDDADDRVAAACAEAPDPVDEGEDATDDADEDEQVERDHWGPFEWCGGHRDAGGDSRDGATLSTAARRREGLRATRRRVYAARRMRFAPDIRPDLRRHGMQRGVIAVSPWRCPRAELVWPGRPTEASGLTRQRHERHERSTTACHAPEPCSASSPHPPPPSPSPPARPARPRRATTHPVTSTGS